MYGITQSYAAAVQAGRLSSASRERVGYRVARARKAADRAARAARRAEQAERRAVAAAAAGC